MSFDKINETLNVEFIETEEVKEIPKDAIIVSENSNDVEADYDLSRKTYKSMIDSGKEAIEQLAVIANESDHPRAFEVLASLIRSVAETTERLMTLQKHKRALSTDEKNNPSTVNNTLVVTTNELLQQVLKQKNEQ